MLLCVASQVDLEYLRRNDRYVTDGVEERVFFFPVGDGLCFAILTRPTEVRSDVGYIVSHPFADEFVNLRRVERAIARRLARSGIPVLSFHRRGYGDSSGSLEDATLSWHLEDMRAAMAELRSATKVAECGIIGTSFGGLIAGLAAREGGVHRLLLLNPVLRSGPYFRGLMKRVLSMRLLGAQVAPQASVAEFMEALRVKGLVDLMGYPLYRQLEEELAATDLTRDVGAFRGDALVLQATRASSPPSDLVAFQNLINERGGNCAIELVKEPPGIKFGQKPFAFTDDPDVFVDLQRPLLETMSEAAARWART
jgi:pimeloyl-ACP methyl ester carboxylesterase